MTSSSRIVLTNCHIIDATSPEPKEGNVVIADGRIQEVTNILNAPTSETIISSQLQSVARLSLSMLNVNLPKR